MITVRLNGGLGNQMFQYATAKALASHNNTELVLDINEFDIYKLRSLELNKYNIKAMIVNQNSLIKKILKKFKMSKFLKSYYIEQNLKYDDSIKNLGNNLYLEGYFQSEKYFKNIRADLIQEFTIKNNISIYTKQISMQVLDEGVTVSLHIRRGDYISDENTNSIHGTCGLGYYKKAIKVLNDKFNDIKHFIFSDDIDWVKENLQIENSVYIDSEEKRLPHEDIYLMSLCSHNIIANSSFSWWGAWLNQNIDKIVIAPKKWFSDTSINASDLIPKNWLRL